MPPVNTPIGKRTPQRTTETLASTELTDGVCVWGGGNAGRGVVGMLTCYDLRFPEPSLLLRKQGAQILTYPAAFTMRTGEAHWGTMTLSALLHPLYPLCEHSHLPPANFYFYFLFFLGWSTTEVLLRARAIETQSYVLAPAQVGQHYPGSSPTPPDSPKPPTATATATAASTTAAPRTSYGKAMIVDPWGTVIARCIDDPAGQHAEGAFCIAE